MNSSGSLRVAVDVGPIMGAPTGVGRYVNELVKAMALHRVAVVPYVIALRGRTPPGASRWRIPARVIQWSWRRSGRPSIASLTNGAPLVHATNFVLPISDVPGVVTVHDLSFYRDDTFPGGDRLHDLVPWSVARAARVLVPTRAVAAEVSHRLAVPSERIAVTGEGVASVFFGATPLSSSALAELGIATPFALAAGTLEPRKNLPRLLRAWDAAGGRRRGWTLVLAGPQGWGPELPQTEGVVPLGWVGDATLPGLMAAADLFCYPSLYEGFGLPPLEAMAAGTAVLAGSYGAAKEVLGAAARLVDPTDEAELASALEELVDDADVRRRLALAGRAQAAAFTWEGAAAATVAAYRAALSD